MIETYHIVPTAFKRVEVTRGYCIERRESLYYNGNYDRTEERWLSASNREWVKCKLEATFFSSMEEAERAWKAYCEDTRVIRNHLATPTKQVWLK